MTRYRIGAVLAPLVILSWFFWAVPALGNGVGVSPDKFTIEVEEKTSSSVLLYVQNADTESSSICVWVDEEDYQDWFEIMPQEFTLIPEQVECVEITVSPLDGAKGTHDANIKVHSRSLDQDATTAVGIIVPCKLTVTTKDGCSLMKIIGICIAFLILSSTIILVWRANRKRRKTDDPILYSD